MKFIADDGMIFDTMEDCEEYEQRISEKAKIARLWHDYVITYNSQGQITEPLSDFCDDLYSFWEELDEIIRSAEKSKFMRIASDCNEWTRISDYIMEQYGYTLPSGVGLWRYDDYCEEWINFEEELHKFKENWEPVGVRI